MSERIPTREERPVSVAREPGPLPDLCRQFPPDLLARYLIESPYVQRATRNGQALRKPAPAYYPSSDSARVWSVFRLSSCFIRESLGDAGSAPQCTGRILLTVKFRG